MASADWSARRVVADVQSGRPIESAGEDSDVFDEEDLLPEEKGR